jgi:uncharacterized protein
MSLKILETTIREFCEHNLDKIIFTWHGGEPLLAGKDFYQKAFNLQKKYKRTNQEILNSIQTNATLIDDKWAKIFKLNHILVGISLDGPKKIHDEYRVFHNGEGSFDRVMQGIKSLKDLGIEFSIISVVTKKVIDNPKLVFDFLVSREPIWINFVPSLAISNSSNLSFKWSIKPSDYIDFLIKIFEMWFKKSDYKIKILPIETIISGFLKREHREYRLISECKKRLAIRSCEKNLVIIPNGDVKTCSFHSYDNIFEFGNIQSGLRSILESPEYKKYQNHLKEIKNRCSKCRWYEVCPNGCPRDFYIGGLNGLFCKESPRLFRLIQESIKKYQISKEWL